MTEKLLTGTLSLNTNKQNLLDAESCVPEVHDHEKHIRRVTPAPPRTHKYGMFFIEVIVSKIHTALNLYVELNDKSAHSLNKIISSHYLRQVLPAGC